MPELPEAETIVRGLRRTILGARIAGVRVFRADVLRGRSPRTFSARLRGRSLRAIGRRGKNVLFFLDDGGVGAVNLGMTGALLHFPAEARPEEYPAHPTVALRFEGGGRLILDDPRRFGTFEALTAREWEARHRHLGPEPLEKEFTVARLARDLASSCSPIRSWLLDQRRVAGVGNIYALEALYRARIHPLCPANRIRKDAAARLHRALREVLRAAIRRGGTTIRNYRDATGGEGAYAPLLRVYGREGEPCSCCGAPVARLVFSARSAYFCPTCQPAQRGRTA